jgi:thiol-disulfide isomerase/thioredoxin
MKSMLAALLVLTMPMAEALQIGDEAPALEGVTWVKGEPPALPGELTLVEFWATWCGPCRRSIPHLTELAKTYAGKLAIAGLSKEDEQTVRPFVGQQGDTMGYSVGVAPSSLYAAYMSAVPGIPHAFLVDKSGIVVWQGHPLSADDILAKAVSGTVDIRQLSRLASLMEDLDKALRRRNMDSIAAGADAVLAIDPFNEKARYFRLYAAREQHDREAFSRLFTTIPATDLSAEQAIAFARTLLSESDLTFRLPETAVELAEAAVEKAPGDAGALAVRARAYYTVGEIDRAVDWQRRAVEVSGDASEEQKLVLDYYLNIQRLKAHSE